MKCSKWSYCRFSFFCQRFNLWPACLLVGFVVSVVEDVLHKAAKGFSAWWAHLRASEQAGRQVWNDPMWRITVLNVLVLILFTYSCCPFSILRGSSGQVKRKWSGCFTPGHICRQKRGPLKGVFWDLTAGSPPSFAPLYPKSWPASLSGSAVHVIGCSWGLWEATIFRTWDVCSKYGGGENNQNI